MCYKNSEAIHSTYSSADTCYKAMSNIEFTQFELDSRLQVAKNIEGDWGKLEDLALQVQDEFTGFVFCGLYEDFGSYHLFLYESDSPLELITIFRVGSHNAGRAELEPLKVEKVRLFMAPVYEKFRFWPYFVDQAGFKCRFLQPISRNDALEISSYVFETGGWEAMIDYQGKEDLGGDPIAGNLYEGQEIFLWWD